jgi:rubrerythrin
MGMLDQLAGWLRGDRRPPRHLLDELLADYRDEVGAAAQLRHHAERAPYPQASAVLRQIADHGDRHAALLRQQMVTLGGTVDEVAPEIQVGRNHWERVTADLLLADAQRRRYIDQSIHWDGEYPEVAAVLARIADDKRAHRRSLEDLIARADSLAID